MPPRQSRGGSPAYARGSRSGRPAGRRRAVSASRLTACASDAPVGRVSTTIPGWQAPPPSVTAARSPGRPGEDGVGPLGQALAGQFRRARGRAVSRGADAPHHPARRGRLGGLADRGPSCGTGDPVQAVLRIRSAAGPRRPAPRAPHAPPADLVVTPGRFGDNPHGGEPLVPSGRRGGGNRTGRANNCGSAVPEAAASATAKAGGVHGRRDRGPRPSPRRRPGRRRPRGQARRRVARAAEGDAAARAHTVVVAARMAQGRAFARHLPPDRSEPAEQQARLQTPPRRRLAVAPERRHQAAGRERQAVADPPSVNALGVRGSSRFTAESHPSFPLTHDALSEGAVRAGDDAWRQHVDRRPGDPEASHSDRWTAPASCRGGPMLAQSPRTAAVTMRRGSSRQKPPGRRRRRRPAGHSAARAARPRPRR